MMSKREAGEEEGETACRCSLPSDLARKVAELGIDPNEVIERFEDEPPKKWLTGIWAGDNPPNNL